LIVESGWIVRLRIDAISADEAIEEVRQNRLPPLLTALEIVGGEAYRVELVRVIDETAGTSQSPATDWALGHPVDIQPMSSDEEQVLTALTATITDDPVAAEGADLLQNALLLTDSASGHTRMLKGAVLSLFQAVERISQEVTTRVPAPVDDHRQRTVIDHLKRALDKNSSLGGKVTKIRKAAVELTVLTGATADAQIRRACAVLGMPPNATDFLADFRAFRNRRLGHPGVLLTQKELSPWLGRGREVAVELVRRYTIWVQEGRPDGS